jgi:hypothetical protein
VHGCVSEGVNSFFFPLLVDNIDLAQSHSTPLTPNLGTYWFKGMVLVQLFGGNIYFFYHYSTFTNSIGVFGIPWK